jgi:integrase
VTPPPPVSRDQVEVISSLLDSRGLDAGDLVDAIRMLADAKQKAGKVPAPDELGMKVCGDKEYLYAGFTDAWIYRNNKTQGRNYYLRVKEKGKAPFVKSLDTSERSEALVKGRLLYQEVRGKIQRGEKIKSVTTDQLIEKYLTSVSKNITSIPKAGLVQRTYDCKVIYLDFWKRYIDECGYSARKIEQIPHEVGENFGTWIQSQKKKAYSDKPYSHEYINSVIVEVKSMYKKYALEKRLISSDYIPNFKSLKVQPDGNHKRHILSEDEWKEVTTYMRSNAYLKPVGTTELEQCKRAMFREYMLIAYSTGCRPNELITMTWGDIRVNPQDSDEDKKIFRLMKVRSENSKTGVSRTINAPVARRLQRLESAYKKMGMRCEHGDFLFRNPAPATREKNISWGKQALTNRLAKLLIDSGVQTKLDSRKEKIVLYSQRHFYVSMRLRYGLNIHLLCKQIGSSVTYVEKNYSHVLVESNTEQMSTGMTRLKTLETMD